MREYYATITSNQTFRGKSGGGYVKITAPDYEQARKAIRDETDNRWAFMYDSLEEVHELDRVLLGEIVVKPNNPITVMGKGRIIRRGY